MIFFQLFWVFFKIGICAFGGAYSFLPLMEKELVENYKWINKQEYLDILAVSNIFPGALSIKYATFIGYKIAGFWGMLLANIGNVLPAAVIIMITAKMYYKYNYIAAVDRAFDLVRIAIAAMIMGLAFEMIDKKLFFDIKSLLIFSGSLAAFIFFKIHPAFVILAAAGIGVLLR